MRWGVLGTGKIAHDFVIALLASETEKVVAVASRSFPRAQEFAHAHNISVAYGSYSELIENDDVELVYVANGSADHVQTTLACIARQKPTLVEKPMALTSGGVKTLAEAAGKAGIFLMEGVWMHFFPVIQQIASLISEGEIGEVSSVQASFGWQNPADANPVEDYSQGGGALGAVGIYLIHLAVMAFGGAKPCKIEAIGELGPLGADVHTSMVLGWEGTKHAILTCSLRANLPGEAVITGSTGCVRIPFPFLCPLKAVVLVDGADDRILSDQLPVAAHEVLNANGDVISNTFNLVNSAGLVYEAEAVSAAVAAGKLQSELVSLGRSLLVLDVMDEVREKIGTSYKCGE